MISAEIAIIVGTGVASIGLVKLSEYLEKHGSYYAYYVNTFLKVSLGTGATLLIFWFLFNNPLLWYVR